MFFVFDERDMAAMAFWGQQGYEAAAYDLAIGEEPGEPKILPHLSYFEFLQDLEHVNFTDDDRHRFFRIRPYLLRTYVKGYRRFVELNRKEA